MIWVDYTFIAIVVISFLFGAFRGLIREGLSLATWIFAFVLTLRYGPDVADRLKSSIQAETIRFILGYAICFFGVLLLGGLLSMAVSWLIRGAGLSGVDRMLGAGFGLLRGLLIVVAFVMVAGTTQAPEEDWWKRSQLIPTIRPAAEQLRTLIPDSWFAYFRPRELPVTRKLPAASPFTRPR